MNTPNQTPAFTPGPWHRNIRREGRYPVVFAGRNQHVATASQQADPQETEANIDLIAAAPELLEALQAIEARLTKAANAFYVSGKRSDLQSALDGWKANANSARAAIAKAIGGRSHE